MKLNKPRGRNKIGLAFGTVCLAGMFFVVRSHCWLSVPNAQITYQGRTLTDAHLYRSNADEFILKLNQSGEFVYWLMPKHKKVMSASPDNFSFFPVAALAYHTDQYGVDLEDRSKDDFPPHIIVGQNRIEFSSRSNNKRIKVAW